MAKIKLSASEVNRFCYCPYQWYYERLYGHGEIQALYKERNRALRLKDSTRSVFAKGNEFHENYMSQYSRYSTRPKLGRFIAALVLAAFLLAIILWVLRYV